MAITLNRILASILQNDSFLRMVWYGTTSELMKIHHYCGWLEGKMTWVARSKAPNPPAAKLAPLRAHHSYEEES